MSGFKIKYLLIYVVRFDSIILIINILRGESVDIILFNVINFVICIMNIIILFFRK